MSRNNPYSYFFVTLLLFLALLTPFFSHSQGTYEGQFYPNPGIVSFRDGKWVGSDHLYNLTEHIDIVVEIFKPEKAEVPFNEEELRKVIADVFSKYKINPQASPHPGEPPLPFLHMLVMLYPVDKKAFAVYTEGRLFEGVELDRIKLDRNTYLQGILWESSNLIVTSRDDLKAQVNKSVEEIATTFGERFQFYANIKLQIKQNQ